MANNSYNRNNLVAPEAKQALNQMKAEMARELTIANPLAKDRGNLTSRQNGYVGGYATDRSVEIADQIFNNVKNRTTTKD